MMLSCQRCRLRFISSPFMVHSGSLGVEAALRWLLASERIPDAVKHSTTSTERGDQAMPTGSKDYCDNVPLYWGCARGCCACFGVRCGPKFVLPI